MDRVSWMGVMACVAALVAWFLLAPKQQPQPAAGQVTTSAVVAAATPAEFAPAPPATAATTPAEFAPAPVPSATPVVAATPVIPVLKAVSKQIGTDDAKYTFSNDSGGIERVTLGTHLVEHGIEEKIFINGSSAAPIGAIGFAPGEIAKGFEMTTEGETAIFTKVESDGLQITKRFSPVVNDEKNPYRCELTIEFRNTGAQPVTRGNYFVNVGGAAPIHSRDLPIYTKFDWAPGGKMRSSDVNWFNGGGLLGFSWRDAQTLFYEQRADVAWAGVASQYYCTVVTPLGAKGESAWAARYNTYKADGGSTPVYGIYGALGMPGFTLAPSEVRSEKFDIYSGPKQLSLLRSLGHGEDAMMSFGMFGLISEALLWGMNNLYKFLHSYGLAIVVLTLIIKSLLWPIQNKATREMRKMAQLGPKMTEMRAKYKDNPQKLNEETMKMYKEYGVNPFSGCLPMLIQIPIFFGFYSMLGSAIELRNSSFLWVQDLSQPDTIVHLGSFPVNLLPIIMAGTMIWQMVISPKSGDAMQQRIFYFMPVIFLLFCYNFASGLALYWTTQNIFSIVQLYLTRNRPIPTLEKKSVVAKRDQQLTTTTKKKRRTP